MHHFQYKKNRLFAEGVPIEEIANQVGTPCYIYSQATLERHFKAFDQAFSRIPHLICYSQKANSNLALLHLFGRLGGGTDIVSGGELYRALKAGIPPERIVYSGVGKTPEEIRYALKEKILLLNIESPEELKLVNEIAGRMKKKAPIGIRVNPDIDPKTHPYISTGLKKNKFGINIHQSLEEYQLAKNLPHIHIAGVDFHIGSQLTATQPFLAAIQKLKKLIGQLKEYGDRDSICRPGRRAWGSLTIRKRPPIQKNTPRPSSKNWAKYLTPLFWNREGSWSAMPVSW